jgi:hypothetical protein
MRYSTRDLMVLVFLVALGILPGRMWVKARQEKARVLQLQNEIRSLEASARTDLPALYQAFLHRHDEFTPFDAMRERSIEQFVVLRQKYRTMEPRGDDVLSIRGIPALSTDTGPAPVIFRLWVPTKRPVWLKFGVHVAQRSVHSSRTSDDESDLLTDSPFDVSSPLEVRLQPGDQTLTISTGHAQNDSLPLLITLDERVLLRSLFRSEGITGANSSHISVPAQLDFGPDQKLPWLLTAHMNLQESATDKTYAFSLWLSDHASNFKTFPEDTHEGIGTETR